MAPSSSSTVDKARSLIEERLAELDDERKRLEDALKGLGGGKRSGGKRSGGKRGPGRPRGSSNKRRRSRKGGTRAEHALKVVQEKPGITPSEIAERLGMKPNYLYRVMNELQKDGAVSKRGRGYFPRD